MFTIAYEQLELALRTHKFVKNDEKFGKPQFYEKMSQFVGHKPAICRFFAQNFIDYKKSILSSKDRTKEFLVP